MKRLYTLTVVSLMGLLCINTVYADDHFDFFVDGIFYKIISDGDQTCEVVSPPVYYKDADGEIFEFQYWTFSAQIPTNVTYEEKTYTVKKIGSDCFADTEFPDDYKMALPETIEEISESAFVRSNIEAVQDFDSPDSNFTPGVIVPHSLKYIGKDAFWGTKLKEANLQDCGSLVLEEYAFYQCPLVSIFLPASLKQIPDCCFASCKSLSSIEIPNSVEAIGECAFAGVALESIVIPNSVTFLGGGMHLVDVIA